MLIKNINVVTNNETFLANVSIENGVFKKITKLSNLPSSNANYMLPGFVDTHTHGGYGWDFNDLSLKNIDHAEKYLENVAKEGVTTVIGTTVTCSKDELERISKNWKKFLSIDKNNIVVGWYIEGPFISKEKKGAHDEKLIVPLDLKLLNKIKKVNKFIKLIAVAPEVVNNLENIKKISNDYVVCIGHSNCSANMAIQSLVNGAKRIIHLYNQTSKFDHRNPGIVNMSFLDTPIFCELICDGKHVDKLVLKNTYDIVKSNRIIMITDSLSCKGLKNGNYMLGTLNILKKSDIAVLASDGTIAGSVKPFNEQLKTFYDATHCSLNDLVKITSYNPAKSIGLDNKIGQIKEKYNADFVILDRNLNLKKTYKNGKLLFNKNKE